MLLLHRGVTNLKVLTESIELAAGYARAGILGNYFVEQWQQQVSDRLEQVH